MEKDKLKYVLDPDNFTGSMITSMHDGVHSDYGVHETLEQIRIRENNPKLQALSFRELLPIWIRYENSLHGPFEEITEDRYYDLLGCLPPIRYRNNSFFVGECYTGNTYGFCFTRNGKYYYAYRNIRTPDEVLYQEIDDFINKDSIPQDNQKGDILLENGIAKQD